MRGRLNFRCVTLFIVLALFAVVLPSAIAGGPFVVDQVNDTGIAAHWKNDTLEWYVDKGDLADNVNNADAKKWIQEALDKWTGLTIQNASGQYVNTVTVKTSFKGTLDEDVDAANFSGYFAPDDGPTAVIFDKTGDIIVSLMGEENRQLVVGLSQPVSTDDTGLTLVKGFAVFNGLLLTNKILSENDETAKQLYKGTVLHELGHLLNLDHAQVNFDIAKACVRNGTCVDGQYIPTMYPQLLTPRQGDLSRDDKIALSWIYPSEDFKKDFCTITGEVFDAKGKPLKGVNVLAMRAGAGEGMAKQDVRAFVSGVLHPECKGDSRYYLYGITPGQNYAVEYEPIGSSFTGASNLEPLDNPPRGFAPGTISLPSGETTVSCAEAGETVEMASVSIDVANPCVMTGGSGESGAGGAEGTASEAGKGCTLVVE